MQPITSLSVAQFRSYEHFSLELSPSVTLIVGPNGSGKTNLLEALYVLAAGTSFRSRDRDLVRHHQLQAGAKLIFENGDSRTCQLQLRDDGRIVKQFKVNGEKRSRLPFRLKLPVVLFEPELLRSLTGSPARRRAFIDTILAHTNPSYSTLLRRYERALLQRNELLKRKDITDPTTWADQLFVWDLTFSKLAAQITKQRRDIIALCSSKISEVYSRLADKKQTITIHYQSDIQVVDQYQQALLARLQRLSDVDAVRGYTSAGPHRDDFVVHLDDHPASETASRGEMRTIMLAFKLIEMELIEATYGTKPLLLLDDVFGELDTIRRSKLTAVISEYQTVITATDMDAEMMKTKVRITQL